MVSKRVEISMRRSVPAGVVVVFLVGGGSTYALVARHALHKVPGTNSAMHAPRVETVHLFSAPISPPGPDLIAAKLAPQTAWPEVPKAKPKGAPKTATSPPANAKPKAKQAANVVGHIIH
jgi:hypothetical protein